MPAADSRKTFCSRVIPVIFVAGTISFRLATVHEDILDEGLNLFVFQRWLCLLS